MNKDTMLKVVGITCSVVGFGLTMIQKSLDDKKLQTMIENEVQRRLNQS